MNKACMSMFAAAVAASLNAATINQVIVRQQWPWSTKVKVEYSLSGVDASHPVDITVSTFNGDNPLPSTNLKAAIEGDLYGITEEFGEFYIDPVVAYGTEKIAMTKFKVKLAISDSPANMSEVLYKIYDLEGGGCTDVTRADLLNGKYGTIETDCSKLGSGYTTPITDVLIWTGVTNKEEYATTKLVLRKIPAAGQTFTMGSPSGETGRQNSDKIMSGGTMSGVKMTGGTVETISGFETQHSVTMQKDFYIGVFEVTQYQWWKINGNWPSLWSLAECKNRRPVENISYDDIRGASGAGTTWPTNATHEVLAASFLGKLRAALSGSPKMDIPTEAQWEYACRAQSTAACYNGYNPTSVSYESAPQKLTEIARYNMDGGYINGAYPTSPYYATVGATNGTALVGSYVPNAWGLYDMLGNVAEWCLDWWGPYTGGAESEPIGPSFDDAPASQYGWRNRSVRGGNCVCRACDIRAAARYHDTYSQKSQFRGFRLCLTVEE